MLVRFPQNLGPLGPRCIPATLTPEQGQIVLFIGGSGSGKSRLAENLMREARVEWPEAPAFYWATLVAGEDPENLARIARHQAQRADLGLATLEAGNWRAAEQIPEDSIVLLDCLGNLVADLCFAPVHSPETGLAERREVLLALRRLAARCRLLIIVGNDCFSHAEPLSAEIRTYLNLLGDLQADLAALPETVLLEAFAGFALCWKAPTTLLTPITVEVQA